MNWLQKLLAIIGRFHDPRTHEDTGHGFNFGHIFDAPDDRDFSYQRLSSGVDLPSSMILSDCFSTVKNQSPANSCVAHALVLAYEMEIRYNTGTEFNGSERQIYYDARNIGGFFPVDGGCRPRDALKTAQKQGIAAEKLCPYNIAELNTPPTKLATSFERWFKIASYHKVDGVSTAREELVDHHPVIFNIPIYPNFSATTSDVHTPALNDPILGYHEMTLVGYDDTHQNPDGTSGAFYFQNSWGESWGTQGRSWIAYGWFGTALPGSPAPTEFWSVRL